MPTYDYECQSCGHTTEIFQSIKEDPITTCPECGKDELKRLISAGVGIIFKGSGFYVTDSKKSGASSGSSEKSNSKSADTSSDSTKGEATKNDTKKSDTKKNDSPSSKKSETVKAG